MAQSKPGIVKSTLAVGGGLSRIPHQDKKNKRRLHSSNSSNARPFYLNRKGSLKYLVPVLFYKFYILL